MPPIVNDLIVWSVGQSPSEPCRKFGSDHDAVCVQDSGGPSERPITYIADHFGQIPYCVHFHLTQYSLLVLFVFRIDALYSVRLFYCIVPSVTLCIALSL